LKALAARVGVSGETVFFYTQQDAKQLLGALAAACRPAHLHRPANLVRPVPQAHRPADP